MNIVVLDGFAVNPGDLSWDFFEKYLDGGTLTVCDKTSDDRCAEVCRAAGAEAVYTNRAKITAELLDACPTIRYVSALGTGYDMIDIEACRARGVAVVNIPAYSTASVAQHTIHLMLSLVTDLEGMCGIVREGMWTGIPGYAYHRFAFTELEGRTLGLLGCGNIGRRVAAIASAMGMRVLASAKNPHPDTDTVKFVPMEQLLGESDILSIHCPLSDETRGMVNADFIAEMKKGAYLVNTARGAILSEADVAAALNAGMLAGAALDVLAAEPALPDNPLLTAKNCRITPHIAWASRAARERLLAVLDASLGHFIETGVGLNRIV